jgi:hypothetical protein
MEDLKFKMIFWFCVATTSAGLLFLAALIFVDIPKGNQQMADVALGFITGTLITASIQYLLGGTPTKKPDSPAIVGGDNITNNTTDPK